MAFYFLNQNVVLAKTDDTRVTDKKIADKINIVLINAFIK
jgi:hypothetical protein